LGGLDLTKLWSNFGLPALKAHGKTKARDTDQSGIVIFGTGIRDSQQQAVVLVEQQFPVTRHASLRGGFLFCSALTTL
jgi:hypothetical protein